MKKIFIQLGQRILKYKKRLIYGALALFFGQICFFGLGGIGLQNEVFADEGGESADIQTDLMTKLYALESVISKIVYMVMYPLLMVAGKLVDNSLVYGKDFGFDVVLWHLWTIVRNIANFGLGFIFIYYIFRYLITQKEEYGWKKLLPKALIAGVLIQASWFIMAALIDISTIMAYGVGGLPITVLGSSDENDLKFNPYILNTVVNVDAENVDKDYVYLSNRSGTQFISTCKTFVYSATGDNGEKVVKELIFSPELVYYKSGESECFSTQTDRCHIGDQVYKLRGDPLWNPADIKCDTYKNIQHDTDSKISSGIAYVKGHWSLEEMEADIAAGNFLRIGQTGTDFGLDVGSKNIGEEWGSYRIQDILSGSYVGVFGALYGSLLNAGADLRISETENNSLYVGILNTALSLGHMIAISIPLMAMLVVFMIRICVLWVAIALSPIIVLLKSFNLEDEIGKKLSDVKFLKYLKVENLIWIIISPAIMCFAISISTVLIRVICAENWEMVGGINEPILGGLVDLSIAGVGISMGKMFVSIIGIAITWFLVWAAVKSSAIGESKIVTGLEGLAKNAIGSMPIVPIPNLKNGGVSWVGMNAAKDLPDQISYDIKRKYNNNTNDMIQDILNPNNVSERRKDINKKVDAYVNKISKIVPTSDWINSPIDIYGDNSDLKSFNDFDDAHKNTIIDKINEMDKRGEFGKATPKIEFGSGETKVIYEFDASSNLYVKKAAEEKK